MQIHPESDYTFQEEMHTKLTWYDQKEMFNWELAYYECGIVLSGKCSQSLIFL